jgi:hypothetical protein
MEMRQPKQIESAIRENALLRYRIVLYVDFLHDRGCSLSEAIRLASCRKWPDDLGRTYSKSTIESWWYFYKDKGFNALIPRRRIKKCSSGALTDSDRSYLDQKLNNIPCLSWRKIHASLLCNCADRSLQPSYYSVMCYCRNHRASQPAIVIPNKNTKWSAIFRDIVKTKCASFPGFGKALQRFGILSRIALIMDSGHSNSIHDACCQVLKMSLFDHNKKAVRARTIENWWYSFISNGVCALPSKTRSDCGAYHFLNDEDKSFLKQTIIDQPELSLKQLHALLLKSRASSTSQQPSYLTVLKYLSREGHIRNNRNIIKGLKVKAKQRDDELLMMNILQGKRSVLQLVNDIKGSLSDKEVAEAYHQVVNGSLVLRNRAMALLSFSMGIKPFVIQKFLGVGVNYVVQLMQRFRARGVVGSLILKPRDKPHKRDLSKYHDALFAILHSPPSAYGINRTSWKMKDLHQIMVQQGYGICMLRRR